MNIYITLILWWLPHTKLEETTVMPEGRKMYGLSFNDNCGDYIMTFKCMTACHSKGYLIYRVDSRCTCTCRDVSTTPIVPYFKWRTSRPTREIPLTQSVSLYHIVGSLSQASPTTTSRSTGEPPLEYKCIFVPQTNVSDVTTEASTGEDAGNSTGTGDGDESTTGDATAATTVMSEHANEGEHESEGEHEGEPETEPEEEGEPETEAEAEAE